MMPLGALSLAPEVSSAIWALASYPEKLYNDVRILIARTYDTLENPDSL